MLFQFVENLFLDIKSFHHYLNNPIGLSDPGNIILEIPSGNAFSEILMINRGGF